MPHSDPAVSACAHSQSFESRVIYPADGVARHPDAVAIRRNPDFSGRDPPTQREHPASVRTNIPRRPAPVASRDGRETLPTHASEAAPPPPAVLVPVYTWLLR